MTVRQRYVATATLAAALAAAAAAPARACSIGIRPAMPPQPYVHLEDCP